MFTRRTLLYGIAALALFALAVTAGKGGKPKPPPEPPPAADPAILFQVSHSQGGADEIWVMNADGTNQAAVITLGSHGLSASRPSWSHDNSRFVFVGEAGTGPGLYVSDIDGSNVTRIADLTTFCEAEWSPAPLPGQPEEDEWIVFEDSTGNADDLFAIRSDGTGLVQLTSTPVRNEEHASVSFDGSFIVYRAITYIEDGGDGKSYIYKAALGTNANGEPAISNETLLVAGQSQAYPYHRFYLPRIDPTGTHLALLVTYSADNPNPGDTHDLWIVPIANPAAGWRVPLPFGEQEYSPAWLDERTVVYPQVRQRPLSQGVVKADISSGSETTLVPFSKKTYMDRPATRR